MEKVNFPKVGNKHAFHPLYNVGTIFGRDKKTLKLPKRAVFVYNGKLKEVLSNGLKLREDKALANYIVNAKCFRSKVRSILVVSLDIGAPLTAIVAEELISLGVKEFLILGSAGSLNKNLGLGELVLCTKAVRDEGTSYHYLKNSVFVASDIELNNRLTEFAKLHKIELRKGITWTIDAPYMETQQELDYYRMLGVSTVEMEAAALFAVAKKRKVRASAIFTISDVLGPNSLSRMSKSKKILKYSFPLMAKMACWFSNL